MTRTQIYGGYHISSSSHLSTKQLQQLINHFNRLPQQTDSPLEGRSSASACQLNGIGAIVVKYFTRGGLIHLLMKHRYLKFGKTRGQKEFELLQRVRDLGINAPEPVAHAYRGFLLYRAWLVTREIRQAMSLARLSLEDEQKARKAMESTLGQISMLIQNGILHVDMHPGNVAVDAGARVYLLDFDKGRNYHGNSANLADRYITRWRRAVVKHSLPNFLAEIMQQRLI
jgi:3-deoxy-D-manno-octulosonic acid kinase